MDGQAKVNLILELKDRMKTSLSQAKSRLNSGVMDMKGKLGDLKSSYRTLEHASGSSFMAIRSRLSLLKTSHVEAFRAMKDEIPGVGRALGLLKNPLMLAGAAVVGLGALFQASTKQAAEFSYGYRQLSMLNIDKPMQDLKALRGIVLDTAFQKGFDPGNTTKAFFDVQSVTGKYGSEVKEIVAKQGEFAQLMQADFNSWIEGTAKAMANYGFGADKLDEFNRAAFATVKTGVTTFDELAKVQSVFAGSAASAKQEFASANKVFSLFTVKVKSADEAATLTKSLFNDLTKQTTIDAFKKIGISMYDNSGKIKQADKLMLELNAKFKALGSNDKSLVALKNQFSGSEGLISFIQAAMDSTGQLQTTLSSFDASEFGLNKALAIAKEDINYINQQLENKLKVSMIKLGEAWMPYKEGLASGAAAALDNTSWAFTGPSSRGDKYRSTGAQEIVEMFSSIIGNPGKHKTAEFDAAFAKIDKLIPYFQSKVDDNRGYKAGYNEYTDLASGLGTWGTPSSVRRQQYYSASGSTEALFSLRKQLLEVYGKLPMNHDSLLDQEAIKPDPSKDENTSLVGSDSVEKITGSANQIRNVTINIDAFVKGGINTEQTNLQQMNEKQIEAYLHDMFMRVIANVDTAYQR
ncbi:phage tail tape measure protein [Williamwhitmania taraxaci]|uniref:Phage tail tape measure protein, TP901 family, core region n=1 Tax=Williamwhitmania taraxaci TaxID=1640674 RepID=A0A1G6MCQ4_9BACT|nr:phage tail tape measure protein [Williamwhitmania taraxaci]SDC53097.1 phage tail tape measure protein, TP901 family, core region [Williamwhitmania taraxaci]